uniref:Transposase Tnp1/En/Spm-like domain-containing protein n=1 Tax=Oryza brachyantha TaxID=4533 RepID=J3KU23_ORYBR
MDKTWIENEPRGYTTWNFHGEASSSNVNIGNSDGAVPTEEAEDDEISDLLRTSPTAYLNSDGGWDELAIRDAPRDLAGGLDDGGDFEDSPLWKDFDDKYPEFAKDSRNVRLAFSTDGFNPYRSQNAESDILVLQQRILEMQQREEQRMVEFPNVETSQHGSNSRQQMRPRSEEIGEANQHVQGEKPDDYAEDGNCDNELEDGANQQATALPAMNITTSPNVQHFSKDALAGSEVILFAMSSDEKVAKATVVSVNPNNKLAGEALTKFCEVIVNVVLKREHVPHPYDEIKTLGDAVKMLVAWPFN